MPTLNLESDMRYIQQENIGKKKEKPLRDLPKQGKYTAKDLQREGIRKGSWEKHDEQRN